MEKAKTNPRTKKLQKANNGHDKNIWKKALSELQSSYALLFITLYLIVMVFLLVMINLGLASAALSPLARFVTSPFSPLEDFSTYYPNVITGYFVNGVFVAVLIFFTQWYLEKGRKWQSKKISMSWVFVSGLIATYLTSAIYWAATGLPGTGTSIMAFGIFIFLTVSFLSDSVYFFRLRRMAITWIFSIFTVTSAAIAFSYVSETIHLIGGSLFVGFLLAKWHPAMPKRRVK